MFPFLPSILGFFLKKPVVIMMIIIAIMVAIGGAYYKGRKDGDALVKAELLLAKKEWEDKLMVLQAKHDQVLQDNTKKYVAKQAVLANVIKTLKKKNSLLVSSHIPPSADKACIINKGFVDLHNKAADGLDLSDLQIISGDAGSPTGVKLSTVGTTVAYNYYQYNKIKSNLEALQEIVKDYMAKQKELK